MKHRSSEQLQALARESTAAMLTRYSVPKAITDAGLWRELTILAWLDGYKASLEDTLEDTCNSHANQI